MMLAGLIRPDSIAIRRSTTALGGPSDAGYGMWNEKVNTGSLQCAAASINFTRAGNQPALFYLRH
jgi:hypothetical protein